MEIIETLVVCEKPDAAARVARALDEDGDPRRTEIERVPLYESRRGKETIFVCSALGHLYSVDSKSRTTRRYYPIWDCSWKPKNLIDKNSARLANWIKAIRSMAQRADRYVNACDYDVEGSLIGFTILRYACNGADSKAERMKFSTMTEKELLAAYKSLAPSLDFSQAEAGKCRHELDWLYGINLSRVLTESTLRQNRGYSTLSTGRVQGPTLKFVVQREEEIECFVPIPFWTIKATIEHNGTIYRVEYAKETISSGAEASRVVTECTGRILEVKDAEARAIQQPPPNPFDLSTLQAEAYKHFGYPPARTVAAAERLYLEALISYPRTSSQQLPPDIGYSEILRNLARSPTFRVLASSLVNRPVLRPNQGRKQDPAHPAIYPTGELPKRRLLHQEANVYDIIVKRFMATFADSSLRENNRLILLAGSHKFFLKGSRLSREGWVEFYKPYADDDSLVLPDLKVGDNVPIRNIDSLEKFTDPPFRYNPGSLLRKMEDENIGTKATRAEIIEILYKRGYIKENRMQATPLAIKIIKILERYCPLITDTQFTAQLEREMERIQTGQATRLSVVAQTLDYLRPVMLNLITNEMQIGADLAETVSAQRVSNRTFSHPCPSCRCELMIIRSRKSGKRFIGCTGYQNGCRFTLPLPQFGTISITSKSCNVCGFELISTKSRGRRASLSCPNCYATKSNEKSKIHSDRDRDVVFQVQPST